MSRPIFEDLCRSGRSLLLLVLALLPLHSIKAQEFLFSDLITHEQKKNPFPRQSELRYRGQESELFPLDSALRAFWSDRSARVESPLFTSIRMALQGAFFNYNADEDPKLTKLREAICRNWSSSEWYEPSGDKCFKLDHYRVSEQLSLKEAIQKEIHQNGGPWRNFLEASDKAVELINSYFFELGKEKITRNFLNYASQEHYPTQIVFSSLYPMNAHIYGDTITVFKEPLRTLDLNFYNILLGNSWATWSDAGEFADPGYVNANALVGYEIHQRGNYPDRARENVGINLYSVQKDYPIELGFYPLKTDNETFVLVFDSIKDDGTKSYCLRPIENTVFHCNYSAGSARQLRGDRPLGTSTDEEAKLIAILELCRLGKPCDKGQEFLKQYRRSVRSLDVHFKNSQGVGSGNILNQLNAFSLDGRSLRIHQ